MHIKMPRCGGRGWRRRRLASNRAARNWPGKTTIFMTGSEREVYFIFWDKNLLLSDCCFRSLSLTLIETAPVIANSGDCNFVENLSRNSNKNQESAQNCYYRLLPDPDCHPAFPRVLPFIFNVFSGSSNWPTFARRIWPEWKFQFSSMCISSLPPVMIWMWHKLPHVCQEYLAEMKISSSQCAFPLSLQFPRVIWMWHKCETCYFLAKYIFLEKAQNNRLCSCNDWFYNWEQHNTPSFSKGTPQRVPPPHPH